MNNPRIALIPIQEIRIVNPRSRNRIKFQSVMTSIGTVGLKKPITVHQRALEDDGTRYDLVCGQGRLEAVRALGDQMVPAIITDAPEDECYLMSLVEVLLELRHRDDWFDSKWSDKETTRQPFADLSSIVLARS